MSEEFLKEVLWHLSSYMNEKGITEEFVTLMTERRYDPDQVEKAL